MSVFIWWPRAVCNLVSLYNGSSSFMSNSCNWKFYNFKERSAKFICVSFKFALHSRHLSEDLLNVITCLAIVISNQAIVIGRQAIVTEFPFNVIGLRSNVSLQYLASDVWWFPVSVWMTVSIRQNLYGTTQCWVTYGTQLKADRKWPFAFGRLGIAGGRDLNVNLCLFVAFELRWNEAYCRQSDSLIQWGLERHTFNWDMFPERSVA